MSVDNPFVLKIFQSTPSGRRETIPDKSKIRAIHISIHSLRTEGDFSLSMFSGGMIKFQSTPSGRRETSGWGCNIINDIISIHSLRTEGDFINPAGILITYRFQSTPSGRRETENAAMLGLPLPKFQSTPSGRRETICRYCNDRDE